MGTEASRQKAQKIQNHTARTIFLNFVEAIDAQPSDVKNSGKFRKMAYAFYKSCKSQPEGTTYISLIISGKETGPQFTRIGINFLKTYTMITKISFRNSSLTKDEAFAFSRFIKSSTTVKEIDLSDNKLGSQGVISIITACYEHPRLEALILENTHADDKVGPYIVELISKKSCLRILRMAPLQLSSSSMKSIKDAIKSNVYLTFFSISEQQLQHEIALILSRNNEIQGILNEIISAPWHRSFKKRNDLFKSVKGHRMVENRAAQLDSIKGTPLHKLFVETQNRAVKLSPKHGVVHNNLLRVGTSETIGVRESMEDASVIKPDFMGKGTILAALFDGHGGREASEYAAKNICSLIEKRIIAGTSTALEGAYKEIHNYLQPWCPYVGTTACTVLITHSRIIAANVGDTRCVVINSSGVPKQMTIDHKPYISFEQKYIEKHGGYVENERVNGVLSVSRSLGDGSLGEAINCCPHISEEQIDGDTIVIIACDGVWDVIDIKQAADIVKSEIDPMLAAKKLRDAAFDAGSTDNISVIVIFISAIKDNKDCN